MEPSTAVGVACFNALIILFVLVLEFDAPPLPVVAGCVWAVVGVYLLFRRPKQRIR